MTSLKWFLTVALIGYCGLVALLYVTQRSLQYFPERVRTAPAAAGLPAAEEVVLDTPDGEKVIVWHVPPRDDKKPVLLYFHGNGGALRHRVERYRALTADGMGLVALSYRGYSGSSGRPTEAGLITDAETAYAFAAARYPADRIAVWGESLGTGVTVAIAAERPVARVVLEAPFTSAADVGAGVYWFIPVRLLMKDQFRSDLRIGKVTAPVLVLHGDRDNVVPFALGERLYAMITSSKRFVRFSGGGHEGLDAFGAAKTAKEFLDGT
jgi:fermentation-respiration switch protein FrsA (DUF1100 family)